MSPDGLRNGKIRSSAFHLILSNSAHSLSLSDIVAMEVSVESNTVESSASTKLRIFCENVENEIKNKSWGWANVPHHSNVKTLKVSAQEGCQLCELVLEGLATHPHGTLGWQYSNIYGQKTFTIRVTHGGVGEVSLELFRDRGKCFIWFLS